MWKLKNRYGNLSYLEDKACIITVQIVHWDLRLLNWEQILPIYCIGFHCKDRVCQWFFNIMAIIYGCVYKLITKAVNCRFWKQLIVPSENTSLFARPLFSISLLLYSFRQIWILCHLQAICIYFFFATMWGRNCNSWTALSADWVATCKLWPSISHFFVMILRFISV